MTTVSTRIEGHTKVRGPEWLVNSREVEIHTSEGFHCVVIRFDSQVSHPAQPEVHSLSSPVSISVEEATVAPEQSTKGSNVGRHTSIIHQILHHLLCHIHSLHRSSPTIDQHGICHDIWTHSFVSLHLLEQVHRTIHVLQLDPTLHECCVSMSIGSQSCFSHHFKK